MSLVDEWLIVTYDCIVCLLERKAGAVICLQ
jgi:hypothetical protein